MADKKYVEIGKVVSEIKRFVGYLDDDMIQRLEIAIKRLPADEVSPVVHGFNKKKDYPSLFECSVCGWECTDTVPCDTEEFNLCPHCGARMEES